MNKTDELPGNPFVSAYSLVKRSGFLAMPIGRRLFQSAYFFYKRHFEDDLEDFLHAFPTLARGGDVLDIGANIGYTATVLGRAIDPGRRVYAFEPEPSNFEILEETAHRCELEGKVFPLPYAVGAENGAVNLWVNDRHHGDHRVITEKFSSTHPGAKQVTVNQVSVDSFLQDKSANISFAKIDVEGYELPVCQGMRDTLAANPSISVFLEFMPAALRGLGFEPSHLIDFFLEREFKIYGVHSGGRLSQGIPANMEDLGYVNLLFSHHTFQNAQ